MTYTLTAYPNTIVRDEDGCACEGCERSRRAGDYCRLHYERVRAAGPTEQRRVSLVRGLSLDKHFNLFFEASKSDERGCLIWSGSKTTLGYGRLTKKGARHIAHRMAYERFKGPVPEELEVCHSCDNPSCVNPDHLFIGTTQDNAIDREAKGRGNHETKRIAFRLRDPNGNVVEGSFLTKFCVEHGLLQPKMSAVLGGARHHHRGWTRYG